MTKKTLGLWALLLALPLILGVLILDQATKWWAIADLCLLPLEGTLKSCASLEGARLGETAYWSAGRVETFVPIIDLDFHMNDKAALSMPIPGPPWFEFLLLLLIMAILAGWLWREGGRHNIIGVGLILGGALGNLVDRALHGAVVDFFALHFGGWTAFIFNVADGAITLGVIWLFVEQLFLKQRRNAQAVVS